jgi:hypothetical protein
MIRITDTKKRVGKKRKVKTGDSRKKNKKRG